MTRLRSLIIVVAIALPAVQAKAQPANAALCVYDSKDYSDGAAICAQKSMMLTCQTDGAKATWKIVTDKDLNAKCVAPLVRSATSEPRVPRHYVRRAAIVQADPYAKCFNFNGKRYCE